MTHLSTALWRATVPVHLLLLGLTLTAACGDRPAGDEETASAPVATATAVPLEAPSLEEMAQAAYVGVGMGDAESIALTDGRWEGEPVSPEGASRPTAGLVDDFRLTGDLNGDGTEEAAVLLWSSGGGSGTFGRLAVVGRRDGDVVNLATADVGDRVRVRRGSLVDGTIQLDVVQAGPEDAACCPTQLATRSWRLTDTGLEETDAEITGTLSVDDIGGTRWVLSRWTRQEPAPVEPEITLVYADGAVSGTSGCNRYQAQVKGGEQPNSLSIGPIAGTRMACPEGLMDLESRYLRALEGATNFSFRPDRLLVEYRMEDSDHMMTFVATDLEP